MGTELHNKMMYQELPYFFHICVSTLTTIKPPVAKIKGRTSVPSLYLKPNPKTWP